MDTTLILIPYIDLDTDAAEVWIGRSNPSCDRVAQAQQALATFAGTLQTGPAGLQETSDHCALWRADRIFLPTDETPARWDAYRIDAILAGHLEPVS